MSFFLLTFKCETSIKRFLLVHWMSHNTPGRQLEADDVLDLRQHVLVHFMRQVSNRQKQILDLHVRGIATEDDVSSGSSHVFLIDTSILVVNPVHCPLNLQMRSMFGFRFCSVLISSTEKTNISSGEVLYTLTSLVMRATLYLCRAVRAMVL